jgi:hypothetical protein
VTPTAFPQLTTSQFYAEKIKQLRKDAIRLNLRRPWDGEDGADFEEARNKLVAGALREAQEAEEKVRPPSTSPLTHSRHCSEKRQRRKKRRKSWTRMTMSLVS